jgi:hypothetical protein
MHRNFIAIAVAAQVTLLCGCANNTAPVTPASNLRGPVAWSMVPAEKLPAPKEGEDAKDLLAQCRVAHGYETAKLVPLQGFAKRATRKTQ